MKEWGGIMAWPKTRFTELLGVNKPIIQAPMIVQKPLVPLAAAVCEAGGLGSLGCAEMTLDELELRVREMRELTDKPFNLNFFLHEEPKFSPSLDTSVKDLIAPIYNRLGLDLPSVTDANSLGNFNEVTLSLLMELKPAMVSFHFGCPDTTIVEKLQSVGVLVAATATTVNEAIQLEQAGVDIVVAQGWEAGGHRGSFTCEYEDVGIGTMALVPQIVDAVSVPVVASGGIGDGRGVAAALALGASAAWMGTAFLTCDETPITAQHREALLCGKDEDTHLSRAFSGRPCRAKKNKYSVELSKTRVALQDFPLMYNYSGPLKKHGIENNDLDFQFLLHGQAVSLNKDLSVEGFMGELEKDFDNALRSILS
jgi:nitronate monooxygenase